MTLTRKLTAFWIFGLAATALLLLLTSALVLRQVADEHQRQRLSALLAEVAATASQPQSSYDAWLPPLLKLQEVREFTLMDGEQVLYQYRSSAADDPATRSFHLSLQSAPHLKVAMVVVEPFFRLPFTGAAWAALALALLLVGALGWQGARWLRRFLLGFELLTQRASLVLRGELPRARVGHVEERPRLASKALDQLIEQLEAARLERSRFDKFIRSNTFLDMETGFGNRLFFDTRLEAALKDNEPGTGGAVYLVQLRDLEQIEQRHGEQAAHEVVQAFSQLLRGSLKGVGDAIVARRSAADFALLVPDLNPREVEEVAVRMVRMLRRLAVPAGIDRESFIHVGVALYQQGDEPYQVLAEADMALRAAQLQGPLDYYMYDRDALDRTRTFGSVRWRTLLEVAIDKRAFVLFMQTAVGAANGQPHHHEVLSRMRDDKGALISAGVFLPMAARCGMTPKIDRIILEQLLRLLELDRSEREPCSVNLAPETLLNEPFMDWLTARLSDTPALAERLIVEVAEYHLAHQLNRLSAPLARLKELGVRLLVDRVGQTVVGSQYIGKLQVDFLKLHPSIVRNIHHRPENQLFVRSLQGSVSAHAVQIFALGVESDAEWRMLRNLGVHGGQGHFFSERLEKLAECAHGG